MFIPNGRLWKNSLVNTFDEVPPDIANKGELAMLYAWNSRTYNPEIKTIVKENFPPKNYPKLWSQYKIMVYPIRQVFSFIP
jgi:hypothetical protein